jgi:hypothetical protein
MVKKTESTIITLKPLELKTIHFTIDGTGVLVTNPFPDKARKSIKEKQNNPPVKKKVHDIRNPYEDFAKSAYWLSPPPEEFDEKTVMDSVETGRFGFHVGGIKNAMTSAAYRAGLVKNIVTANGLFFIRNTEKDYIYSTDCVQIISDPPIMREDCLSTFNSGADMRYRAMFDNWSMDLQIEFDSQQMDGNVIADWLRRAGFSCGLGEYRAEKGGSWGGFVIRGTK